MLVWIDFTCPFCYIATKRLFSVLEDNNLDPKLEIKSFLINPNLKGKQDYINNLMVKYNISRDSAKNLTDNVVKLALEDNIELNFEKINEVNTKNAHKLIKFFEKDKGYRALILKIFEEYFIGYKNINSIEVLDNILKDLNMDTTKVKDIVDKIDDAEIEKDIYQASTFKISNTPTILLRNGKKYVGSRNYDEYLNIIKEDIELEG